MSKTLTPDHPVFENKGDADDNAGEIILNVRFGDDPITDRDGRTYSYLGDGEYGSERFLSDDDFYQGLNMVTVIKRDSDGKLFGYFWWDDISKHGSSMVESNGDEFGLECDTDADDFDWDTDYVSYYVWEPVEPFTIVGYRAVSNGVSETTGV